MKIKEKKICVKGDNLHEKKIKYVNQNLHKKKRKKFEPEQKTVHTRSPISPRQFMAVKYAE